MEIYGKNNLLSNNYDYITFDGFCDFINCRIISKSKKKIMFDKKLEKELCLNKSDSQKFFIIVNFFLENNIIDSIKQDIELKNYFHTFTQITSNNKKLNFHFDLNDDNIQVALKNILSKFNDDRNNILYESINYFDKIIIEPDLNESSINIVNDYIIIKYISNKKEDMIQYDQNFIINFLIFYIDYSNKVEFSILSSDNKSIGIVIRINAMEISIKNSRMIDSLIQYIEKHNKELENNKELLKEWRKYNGNNNG